MKRLILLAILPLLTGCAGLGFDDYAKYADTLKAHSQAESERIQAQASAIRDTVSRAVATDNERLLLAVIGSMQIERLAPVPLPIEKPITGFQVLNTVAGQATALAGFGAMGWVATAAFSEVGNVSFDGDGNTYSPFESHVTGSSQATTQIPYQSPTTTNTYNVPVQ